MPQNTQEPTTAPYNERIGPMVECRGVAKVFAGRSGARVEALAEVSLAVAPGDLAVVVGSSGAGKSTLLRILWGEERATRGHVVVDGAEVGALRARGLARLRRRLGIVTQERRLLPDRTVFGNVAFVLRALAVPREEARERALDGLREAGLGARLSARPAGLSAGERQRLCLARALALDPALVLADEPTAMLDEASAQAVCALLRAARRRGAALVVATHAAELAARLDGRLLRLASGRLAVEAAAG